MINAIRKASIGFMSALLLTLTSATIAQSTTSYAQDLDGSVKCGSNVNLQKFDTSTEAGRDARDKACGVGGNGTKIENVIKTIINIFSAIVGAVSVIMIILGGFKYITSSGDSNNISSAKNTILYALVGLVVVAFAQVIVQFVLERTT